MNFDSFRDAMLLMLLSGGVYILRGMKDSVDLLNVKIAVVVERTDNHEKRLDKLEEKSRD